jgi:hypothetical protein
LASSIFLALPGTILSGLSVYFVLSYLLIPIRITIPISVLICILIFGLTKYYHSWIEKKKGEIKEVVATVKKLHGTGIADISFILVYIILLFILLSSAFNQTGEIFTDWQKISANQLLNLLAAVAFCFFLPGYALVMLVNKSYKLAPLPNLLLSYLISMLITGLAGYVFGSLGYSVSVTKVFVIYGYILILIAFCIPQIKELRKNLYHINTENSFQSVSKLFGLLTKSNSILVVFMSLFALVILYTYYLNDGQIIVDQWYHHGRALLIGSEAFKDLAASESYRDVYDPKESDLSRINPPFFSSLLAVYFNLSGSPSANAYVAINFLNFMPVLAFYYFFYNWVPNDKKRASLIATTLFMLSSGFGWVYALDLALTSPQDIVSTISSVNLLSEATDKTYDIGLPTTFINVAHPDITTPLIIIALPAGFTLLGLIKERKIYFLDNGSDSIVPERSKYLKLAIRISIIVSTLLLGIFSHDEFYLFVMTASTSILVLFKLLPKFNYSIFFASFLLAISLVILVDLFISPAKFYTSREIIGIPLIYISFFYVSITWSLYCLLRTNRISIFHSSNISIIIAKIKQYLERSKAILKILNYYQNKNKFLKLCTGIIVVSIVAWLYLFAFLVWNQTPVDTVRSQIKDEWNVPWYLYPIKFGVTGFLGLAFIVSYIFKKYEKIIFVFGILAILAFFAGPYYDEHRAGKYVMSSMAAFAGLLIYKIISSSVFRDKLKLRPLVFGIFLGTIVIASSLSVFMYAGYVELFTGKAEWIEGGRRDFPTESEFKLLSFLRNEVVDSKAYNIAMPEKQVDNSQGFITKIYGFSAIPRVKLLQSPLTLNASSIETLYDLLQKSDVKYIIFLKKDIVTDLGTANISNLSKSEYANTSNLIDFVLQNFPRRYEDNDYIVFQVLPFRPPSPNDSNVAVIYQKDAELLPSAINKITFLPYDHELFKLQKGNVTKNNPSYNNLLNKSNICTPANLAFEDNVNDNNDKGTTLWSAPIQEIKQICAGGAKPNETTTNFIEGTFRITNDLTNVNKIEKNRQDSNYEAAIVWHEENNEFRVSIGESGLELSQSPYKTTLISEHQKDYANDSSHTIKESANVTSASILFQNQEIKREKGIWYNLKILSLNNTIDIYVDDILRIKAPKTDYYHPSFAERSIGPSISRVGISSVNSKVEFQPLITGQIPDSGQYFKNQREKLYLRQYYPISLLALSKIKYDTFLHGDLSAFSKKYVILPFDIPSTNKDDASKFIEYVSRGGNLVVINSRDINFDGVFSKLFWIKPYMLTKFDNVTKSPYSSTTREIKDITNMAGITHKIEPTDTENITIHSSFTNNNSLNKNQIVAPLVLEKKYGNGKIIFVNMVGHYNSTIDKFLPLNQPQNKDKNLDLMKLPNFLPLIGLWEDTNNHSNITNSHAITSVPLTRIIGDLNISPDQNVMINSSSISFPQSNNINKFLNSYNLTSKKVTISNPLRISILDKQSNHTYETTATYEPQILQEGNNDIYNIKFNNVIIKDFRIYGGPYQFIINSINSSHSLHLPASSSYRNYIGISIPKGFDMTIRLFGGNTSYFEGELITMDDYKKYIVRIYGNTNDYDNTGTDTTEIKFFDVQTDVKNIGSISALMKMLGLKITNKDDHTGLKESGEGSTALSFKRDSSHNKPIKINKLNGNITSTIGYVDDYNERRLHTIKTQFVTYLDQNIQIIKEDATAVTTPGDYNGKRVQIAIPGDISAYAKEHGIEVTWEDAFDSNNSIIMVLSIGTVTIILIALSWLKVANLNKKS